MLSLAKHVPCYSATGLTVVPLKQGQIRGNYNVNADQNNAMHSKTQNTQYW